MAFHGGHLEKVTDIIASSVAQQTGSSYYEVLHAEDVPTHMPSKLVDPAESPKLAEFLDHVDVAIAFHGYGRDHLRRVVLLGGSHRTLAAHLAASIEDALPKYEGRYDLDEIPPELRGVHVDNPVNRPRGGGVQIELPPSLRWHWDDKNWSDFGGARRAPQVDMFIGAMVEAIHAWDSGTDEKPSFW